MLSHSGHMHADWECMLYMGRFSENVKEFICNTPVCYLYLAWNKNTKWKWIKNEKLQTIHLAYVIDFFFCDTFLHLKKCCYTVDGIFLESEASLKSIWKHSSRPFPHCNHSVMRLKANTRTQINYVWGHDRDKWNHSVREWGGGWRDFPPSLKMKSPWRGSGNGSVLKSYCSSLRGDSAPGAVFSITVRPPEHNVE